MGTSQGEVAVEGDAEVGEEEKTRNQPLRAVKNIGGYSTVLLPGASPALILQSATSMPKVMPLRGKGIRGMSGFNTLGCAAGWIAIDVNVRLPPPSPRRTPY
jgi:cleavage and polyadenylation specificity factor subunit 1